MFGVGQGQTLTRLRNKCRFYARLTFFCHFSQDRIENFEIDDEVGRDTTV